MNGKSCLSTPSALLAVLLSALNLHSPAAFAQGTGFTYQGRLNDGGAPANGSYVFRFSLDDGKGGPVGTFIVTPPVNVTNGLFTVTLDFGPGIFTNANRRLNIEVRTNLPNLNFTALTPPQPILPAPYAIYAEGADATGIIGVVPNAFSAANATNFSGLLLGEVTGTQGATVVSTVGGQSATNVANGVSAANAANAANVPSAIVKRDGKGDFSAGTATLSGALHLPFPAIIFSGTNTLLIAEGSLFYGTDAGLGRVPGELFSVGVGDYVLSSGTSGPNNTGVGERALEHNTSGSYNTANGYYALRANTSGEVNTASGATALQANTTGNANTATGSGALYYNMTGDFNTATGVGALRSNTSGSNNTASGFFALHDNTTGSNNTATGHSALHDNLTGEANTAAGVEALRANTIGDANTANGVAALQANMTGNFNTANGVYALSANTTGEGNTASGFVALRENTTGSYNTANGAGALRVNKANYSTASGASALEANTTGEANTANGSYALSANTTGEGNTATGFSALSGNTTGGYNTANGIAALQANAGSYNTANGSRALQANTTGLYNTANGANSLLANTTGGYNTANGDEALKNNTSGGYNTATGVQALENNQTGSFNIALGFQAGSLTTGEANIDIGNEGVAAESGAIRIGTQGTQTSTFIAGISRVTVASGVAVVVDTSGQLGIRSSSARFKQDIHSMEDASEVLLSLRPVTFRYKPELDPRAIPQFGLVAEEVEKVEPDLVARDDKNQVYTVRYEAVNAMLLNEFLKQHRKVKEQCAEIEVLRQKAGKVDALEKRLNELAQTVQAQARTK